MITTSYRKGYKVLAVNTKEAVYKNLPWHALGGFGKRKFENLLFLKNQDGQNRIKIIYT